MTTVISNTEDLSKNGYNYVNAGDFQKNPRASLGNASSMGWWRRAMGYTKKMFGLLGGTNGILKWTFDYLLNFLIPN
jgi:hypothetical protein